MTFQVLTPREEKETAENAQWRAGEWSFKCNKCLICSYFTAMTSFISICLNVNFRAERERKKIGSRLEEVWPEIPLWVWWLNPNLTYFWYFNKLYDSTAALKGCNPKVSCGVFMSKTLLLRKFPAQKHERLLYNALFVVETVGGWWLTIVDWWPVLMPLKEKHWKSLCIYTTHFILR